MKRFTIAVHAVWRGADGRNGLRYVDSHGVTHCCVIGSLYGTFNQGYRTKGKARSRDIYQQVALRFDLDRGHIERLLDINDLISNTLIRRVALTLYLVVVKYGRLRRRKPI